MTNIIDGLSYLNSLDAQINSLRNQQNNSISSDNAVLTTQKSFDTILSNFLSPSSQSKGTDPFLNFYSLDSQITALKNLGTNPADPNSTILTFQSNLNKIMNTLYNSSDEEDTADTNEEYDPFSSWSGYQNSINNINFQISGGLSADYTSWINSLNINSYNGLASNDAQYNLLLSQSQSDLSNIF